VEAFVSLAIPFLRKAGKTPETIRAINQKRDSLRHVSDAELASAFHSAPSVADAIAAVAVAAARVLHQEMFDVQIHGALALAAGRIAEMQTGEGKTLAAVPAVAWQARKRKGVHVMTANDYLARRDAAWMGDIFRLLGFTVAWVQQGMTTAERQAAYRADITYATATEVGFDYLRDQLALHPGDQVHRPFASAVIDEADSILIDEARIPLVIAGGTDPHDSYPAAADTLARQLRPGRDFHIETASRNISLTDHGIALAERILNCPNLYAVENLPLLTAVQDALHAHTLLHRDIDYIVRDGIVQSIDEWKGRIAQDRRWPAGLQTAIEVKERVTTRPNGSILGSVTLQNLIALYPEICGMTGTAASQASEFKRVYGLEVEVIPTNRPMIRVDHPDVLCSTKAEKEHLVIEEIRRAHATGQPVLVGTGSVQESERLAARLSGLPHHVLNARNDEAEAAIIGGAGQRNAVTISTNMAGRGTDIQLGEGVAELGGLYVIGLNRHESRRIDNQLRGRSGRQGDPGESRFFVSREDDLVIKYQGSTPEEMQRIAEGLNLQLRLFLQKYESAVEGQRLQWLSRRQAILEADQPDRQVRLRAMDDLWAGHLANIAELKSGVHWVSWAGRDPHFEFLNRVHEWYEELLSGLESEIDASTAREATERGAVWTYMTTDQPWGTWEERLGRGWKRKINSWTR
jgi:preprotein translocase subunit SecA